MSIIFQTIFNLLKKRGDAEKGSGNVDDASKAPASRPPRPFYPDSEPEEDPDDGREEGNRNGTTPPNE